MAHTAHTPQWIGLFKQKTDFIALLEEQAKTTLDGISGLHEWLKSGAPGKCSLVHDLEHQADRQKSRIEDCLRDTFVTPFDREEIYDLSAKLDLIINGAKRVAKDIEFFDPSAVDPHTLRMAQALVMGTNDLFDSIKQLGSDLNKAGESANRARKTETTVDQIFREAMKDLLQEKNLGDRMQNKHVFDCLSVISQRIERLGEKLLHISIKLD